MTEYDFLKDCEKNFAPYINENEDIYWYDLFLAAAHFADGKKDYRDDLNRVDLADHVKSVADLRRISRETTIPVPVLRRFLNGGHMLTIWTTILAKWIQGDSPVANLAEAQFYRKNQLYTYDDLDDFFSFFDRYPTGYAKERSADERALIEAEIVGMADEYNQW